MVRILVFLFCLFGFSSINAQLNLDGNNDFPAYKTTADTIPIIVVLGSSTAAGTGPTSSDSAWVNRYRKYVTGIKSFAKVFNLAVGGYTTYDIMPTGFKQPSGRPSPKTNNNITKALSYLPDAIIINLPSNDATNGYPISEQLYNYSVIDSICEAKSIPLWVATTQPRNLTLAGRNSLMAMRDSTYARYGEKAIDFWTDVANVDGTISSLYNSGDGIHLNNAAHRILFNRVVQAGVWEEIAYVGVEQDSGPRNQWFTLNQNYPNPFNAGTQIPIRLQKPGRIRLEVINILGQVVSVIADREFPSGYFQFLFEPEKSSVGAMGSGIYFIKATSSDGMQFRRMIYLK